MGRRLVFAQDHNLQPNEKEERAEGISSSPVDHEVIDVANVVDAEVLLAMPNDLYLWEVDLNDSVHNLEGDEDYAFELSEP